MEIVNRGPENVSGSKFTSSKAGRAISLTKPKYDFYADSLGLAEGNLKGSLYYYLLTKTDIDKAKTEFQNGNTNYLLIPPIEAIQNVIWMPYSKSLNYSLGHYTYDAKRFPVKGATDQEIDLPGVVKRVIEVDSALTNDYPLAQAEFEAYFMYNGYQPGGAYSFTKEAKIYQYPYSYSVITDHINEPLLIKPHLCKNARSVLKDKLLVKQSVSNLGTCMLYVEGYKGDMTGLVEGTITTKPRNLPIVSSAYSSYMSSSQAQIEAQKKASGQNALFGTTAGVVSGLVAVGGLIAAPFTGGLSLGATVAGVAGIAGGASSAYKSTMSHNQTIAQLNAQSKDYSNMPNRLTDGGTMDTLFSQSVKPKDSGLDIYAMIQPIPVLERVAYYFHLYGYKQNRVLRPNLRNRYYFNFIKTVGVNMSCKDGNGIPKEHFNKLKSIYDNGTTVWHISRAGVNVGDYSMDNYEV